MLLWTRELGFLSGAYRIEERVIGASSDGLVLNTFEVVSPSDGRTLVPPRTQNVDSGERVVPERSAEGPALWLPTSRRILHFAAEASFLKATGGLWAFDPSTGEERLVEPVRKVFSGAFWRIEDLAVSPDGRWLFLAKKLGQRGSGGVGLTVVLWPEGSTVWEHELGREHFCRDPRLVVEPSGDVRLVYRDETAGQYAEARFGVRPRR